MQGVEVNKSRPVSHEQHSGKGGFVGVNAGSNATGVSACNTYAVMIEEDKNEIGAAGDPTYERCRYMQVRVP